MDSKAAQLKAKYKLQFWTFVLFSILVIGAGYEYLCLIRPLDAVTVVYVAHQAEPIVVQEDVVTPQPVQEQKVEAEPQPVSLEPEPAKAEVQPVHDAHPHAAQEFLNYMQEMKDKVEAVTFNETVLDKVKSNETSAEQQAPAQPQFEENKIQVYDEHKGVVEVIDTPVEVKQPEVNENKEPVAVNEPVRQQVSEEKAIAEQMQAVQAAKETVEDITEQVQTEVEKSAQAVQELMDNVGVTEGEEKPIVLIPGLQSDQN